MYIKPIKLNNETKQREFQFNFLSRIVTNNSFLSKCKIGSSSLCDFCNANPDSLEQMFGECHHIHSFGLVLPTRQYHHLPQIKQLT